MQDTYSKISWRFWNHDIAWSWLKILHDPTNVIWQDLSMSCKIPPVRDGKIPSSHARSHQWDMTRSHHVMQDLIKHFMPDHARYLFQDLMEILKPWYCMILAKDLAWSHQCDMARSQHVMQDPTSEIWQDLTMSCMITPMWYDKIWPCHARSHQWEMARSQHVMQDPTSERWQDLSTSCKIPPVRSQHRKISTIQEPIKASSSTRRHNCSSAHVHYNLLK